MTQFRRLAQPAFPLQWQDLERDEKGGRGERRWSEGRRHEPFAGLLARPRLLVLHREWTRASST
jgi:hypothetical protein